MEDKRITLETAKLLKEKKFDIYTHGAYVEYNVTWPHEGYKKGDVEIETMYFKNNDKESDYSCVNYTMYARPTQSLVQKWLREVYNIQVYVLSTTRVCDPLAPYGQAKYRDYIAYVNNRAINDARDEEFQTYEDALEVGLQIAIKELS